MVQRSASDDEARFAAVANAVGASVAGLTTLERRALVVVALAGPQPLDRLAERLGSTVAVVGAAARCLVARGVAVRVPRGRAGTLPMLVASTGGTAIVRDALRTRVSSRPAPRSRPPSAPELRG